MPDDSPPRTIAALVVPVGAALLALAGLFAATWISKAPNRLLPGAPLDSASALGGGLWALAACPLICLAVMAMGSRRLAPVALAAAGAGLVLAVHFTGRAAFSALEGAAPAARAMVGAGAWMYAVGLGVLLAEAARRSGRVGAIGVGLVLAAIVALVASGGVDALSLAVEARGRGADLRRALGEHLVLAAASLLLASAIACPVAVLALRSRRAESVAQGALALIQVIPAIALFGLLVPLLALILAAAPGLRTLGLGAIGGTPAIICVGLYLALPLASALVAGLRAPDRAVIEAGRAMGFSETRLMMEVRLPLAMPALIGGFRLATVQSVGLVTLGGLIGAGGFGALVFEGMAQFAPDLILLASLPVVLTALCLDAALGRIDRRQGSVPA
jgi:osmoprotectant transport system permease protein